VGNATPLSLIMWFKKTTLERDLKNIGMIVKNAESWLQAYMVTKLKSLCNLRLILKGVHLQDLGSESPSFKLIEVSTYLL